MDASAVLADLATLRMQMRELFRLKEVFERKYTEKMNDMKAFADVVASNTKTKVNVNIAIGLSQANEL